MMRPIYRTTRWLVTTSLIVSLGLAGLFPQMMFLAENGARISVSPSPTKCCCGTEDGRCCGMGCCLARAPSPEKEPCPCPSKDDNRQGRNSLLAMVVAKDLASGSGQGSPFGRVAFHGGRSLAEATLQAKHIRIDA